MRDGKRERERYMVLDFFNLQPIVRIRRFNSPQNYQYLITFTADCKLVAMLKFGENVELQQAF
jgi:hypothetical protein